MLETCLQTSREDGNKHVSLIMSNCECIALSEYELLATINGLWLMILRSMTM